MTPALLPAPLAAPGTSAASATSDTAVAAGLGAGASGAQTADGEGNAEAVFARLLMGETAGGEARGRLSTTGHIGEQLPDMAAMALLDGSTSALIDDAPLPEMAAITLEETDALMADPASATVQDIDQAGALAQAQLLGTTGEGPMPETPVTTDTDALPMDAAEVGANGAPLDTRTDLTTGADDGAAPDVLSTRSDGMSPASQEDPSTDLALETTRSDLAADGATSLLASAGSPEPAIGAPAPSGGDDGPNPQAPATPLSPAASGPHVTGAPTARSEPAASAAPGAPIASGGPGASAAPIASAASAAPGAPGTLAAQPGAPQPADGTAEAPLPATASAEQTGDRRQALPQTTAQLAEATGTASGGTAGAKLGGERGDERGGQQQSPAQLIALDGEAGERPGLSRTDAGTRPSFGEALLTANRSASLETSLGELPARLRIAAANGVERMTVSLRPASLGAVDVQIDSADDGSIRTTFLVQRPETLDLLQRDARLLERALSDAGLNVSRDSLSFSLSDQQGRHAGFEADGGTGQGDGAGGEAGDAGPDGAVVQDILLDTPAIIEAGRVDVHI